MALQGVQNKLFELLQSTDINAQDFIASLQPGDSLRGRVVDILAGDSKAIINFKGYNLISQLPQGMNLQKGDIINVMVSQLDNRIFMKIDLSGISKGIDPQQALSGATDTQQIIDTLNALKISVNEQNIFIAQTLMDYHLAVSAESISNINDSLAQYFNARGIDSKAFNIETPVAAKSLLISNFFKLGIELENAAGSLKDMARILDNRGQLAVLAQDITVNDIAVKVLNMLKTMDAASAASPGTSLNINETGVVLTIQTQQPAEGQNPGIDPGAGQYSSGHNPGISVNAVNAGGLTENLQAILNAAIKEGIVGQEEMPPIMQAFGAGNAGTAGFAQAASIEAEAVQGSVNAGTKVNEPSKDNIMGRNVEPSIAHAQDGETAAFARSAAIGTAVLTAKPGGILELEYRGLPQIVDDLIGNAGGQSQAVSELKDAFVNNVFSSSGQARTAVQAAVQQQEPVSLLPDGIKALVSQIRGMTADLSSNIISPRNSSLQANVQQSISLMSGIKNVLNNISGQLDKTSAETAAINELRTDVLKISDAVNNAQRSFGTAGNNGEISVTPGEYSRYQAVMRAFMGQMDNIVLLKAPQAAQNISVPVQAGLPVDTESTIEALTFLKSRNIPADNVFIDIMSSYFKSDMKLSGVIEALNTAMNKFDADTAKNSAANQAQFSDIRQTISDIRNNIQNISIKTSDMSLKNNIIEDQLRAFAGQSGLNIENRLLNQLNAPQAQPQPQQSAAGDAAKAAGNNAAGPAQVPDGDNLKSNMIRLSNEIQNIDSAKLTSTQHEIFRQMREAANDILTNLNALQFMNHKPVSYEMAYTQVPVFFNNALFNGELQVWYRKGAIKEDLRANTPVNLVFMLNTSNLGTVKLNITIYKNEVECVVKAENEKAKQLLMRGKNDFLSGLKNMKYNVKTFNIQLDNADTASTPSSGEGYINIGRVNLQA